MIELGERRAGKATGTFVYRHGQRQVHTRARTVITAVLKTQSGAGPVQDSPVKADLPEHG